MPKLNRKPKQKTSSDIFTLEKLLQTYEKHCMLSQTCVSPTIKQSLQKCIANDTLITKFVLTNAETSSGNLHPVSLTPLLRTIRDQRYRMGKELSVWGIKTSPQDIANLAILLELDGRTICPFTKLEITHQVLDLWSTERLGIALPYSNLSSLVLDYSNNLFLNGNHLQCLGAIEILIPVAEYAEKNGQGKKANTLENSNTGCYSIDANKETTIYSQSVSSVTSSKGNSSSAMENNGKKKKRKGYKKRSKQPDPGPWLAKLRLADNAIDGRFNQGEENLWKFIVLLTCLITNSDHLVEADINGNAIGEQCAIKILEALRERKKEELPCLKIKVTHQISSVAFEEIFRICSKPIRIKKRKKKTKGL